MSSTENTLLNILYQYNPWWKSLPFIVPQYRTSLCKQLIQEKDCSENELIYGPRQVGKTVLMKQMIKYLLEECRVPPHNILYLSMDHTFFSSSCDKPIQDAIDAFLKYVLPPDSEKAYIFLDEVQSIENCLKEYYSHKTPKIKFYISTCSVFMNKESNCYSILWVRHMFQWSFADYVQYHQKNENNKFVFVPFHESNIWSNPNKLYEMLLQRQEDLLKNTPSLERYLTDYIIKGGYPGLFGTDLDQARDILMERLMLTLYKDIIRSFELRNVKGLENTVLRCAMQSGHITDHHSFAKTIGIKYDTLKVYLKYLLDTLMISESVLESKKEYTPLKERILYFRDHPTRNMLIGLLNTRLFEYHEEVSRTVETIVQDHVARLELIQSDNPKSYYWKGKREVVLLMEPVVTRIPIVVRYRQDMDDISGLREYIKKSGSPYGIVVTEDTLELVDNVVFMPLALFLLISR